jgi:ribosome-associated protein
MISVTANIKLDESQLEERFIRSPGPGGQNVNKVSTAIHLRFDIKASSLPDFYKSRLLNLKDKRISKDGVVIIKAQSHRTQEKNRTEALERLRELIKSVAVEKKKRISTKPGRFAKAKRMDAKTRRGRDKQLRRKVSDYE